MQEKWKKTMGHESDGDTSCNCALGTATKGLMNGLWDKKIRGRVETIQTTAILRSDKIIRRTLGNWEDLLSIKNL